MRTTNIATQNPFVHVRFAVSWQVQHFVTCRGGCFDESQCQGCANMTQCQKSRQEQHFVSCLKSGASQKSYFLSFVKWLYKKNSQEIVDFQLQSVKSGGSLARNARFATSTSQAGRWRVRLAWLALCDVA